MWLTDSYEPHLTRLHDGIIGYLDFIRAVRHEGIFKMWCDSLHIDKSEDSAELFYDMHGYEESGMVEIFAEEAVY